MTVRFDVVAFAIGLALFAYLFGAYSAEKKLPTYPEFLEDAFSTETVDFSRSQTAWQEARSDGTGVTRRRDAAGDGVTFYTSAHRQGARLVAADGSRLHEWSRRFRSVWKTPGHVDAVADPETIRWRYAHLYPNGDVLAVFEASGEVPHGYGMVKIGRDSEVQWRLPRRIHHQAEVTDDGTIYALARSYRDLERHSVPGNPQIAPEDGHEILDERLLEIGPGGDVRRNVSLLSALIGSPFEDLLQNFPGKTHRELYDERRWDPVHATDIEVATEALGERVSPVDAGDWLVSVRPLHTVMAVDPEARSVVWASRGIWTRQHDLDVLANGRFLVFDNLGHAGDGGRSRILEIAPRSNEVAWDYTGTTNAPFVSFAEGSQQRLPNGHVLVTEAQGGRIFEVTESGELVWEFRNPARRTTEGSREVAQIHAAKRYRRNQLEFLQ